MVTDGSGPPPCRCASPRPRTASMRGGTLFIEHIESKKSIKALCALWLSLEAVCWTLMLLSRGGQHGTEGLSTWS